MDKDYSVSHNEKVNNYLLRTEGVSKRFTSTIALKNVDFKVHKGEIHALLGENGAGKSTLIKILAGIYKPDSGRFWIEGEERYPYLQDLPIVFIHQDLGLIDSMSVAENLAFVADYGYHDNGITISWSKTYAKAKKILKKMGANIAPEVKVSTLSAAEKSIITIARALAKEAKILVLDEPTASLSGEDINMLFKILERLKKEGLGLVYVTHRLDEVFRIANRVTVLRDGKKVYEGKVSEITPNELVLKIVGRPLSEVFIHSRKTVTKELLKVENLQVKFVEPISFTLREGEVLALAGLRGAGNEEIGRAIFGDLKINGGEIKISGKNVQIKDPFLALKLGIGLLSSKREEESILGGITVRENIYINPIISEKNQTVLSIINLNKEKKRCYKALERYRIRPQYDTERLIETFSGGNKQKAMIARWFEMRNKILILENPTIGVDVRSKGDIYNMIDEGLIKYNMGFLLVSSDFEEIANISHRVIVLNRGRVTGELEGDNITIESVIKLAS